MRVFEVLFDVSIAFLEVYNRQEKDSVAVARLASWEPARQRLAQMVLRMTERDQELAALLFARGAAIADVAKVLAYGETTVSEWHRGWLAASPGAAALSGSPPRAKL